MLKMRYKVFLVLFLIITITGILISSRVKYSYSSTPVPDHRFQLSAESESGPGDTPVWFTFQNNTAILHVNSDSADLPGEILFRPPYGDSASAVIQDFQYTEGMNGTLLVQTISRDGSVLATAKSSTVNTQSYDSFAWDSHTFGDAAIPIEICYDGSRTHSTDLTVLCYGQPYNGTVRVQSAYGTDQTMEITDGILSGLHISDVRKGVSVSFTDAGTGKTLIGSYIAEDYPLFTTGYLYQLSQTAGMILTIAAGCLIILLIRRKVFRKQVV